MKLDTKALRYLTAEDWRVLTAVETGSRNHEVVPTPLIVTLSGLRGGSAVHKSISNLAKVNLIARLKNAKYDGYRLTYGGLDYLALHTHLKRSTLFSLGNQIGVGKESDIYVAASPSGTTHVVKLHRLGRISFRTVKANRDYLRHRASGSWMYMSRLAALKEFTFMKALRENGFPVPEPISHSRHTIVMSLIDAFPLRQISEVPDPAGLYSELMEMILRLARFGLIHGDFNEFNILIKEETKIIDPKEADSSRKIPQDESDSAPSAPATTTILTPILIDFPQMVSMSHTDAAMYFDRDVNCIKTFFKRRFHFTSSAPGPFFKDAKKSVGTDGTKRLDVEAEASGFSRKMAKELESYMRDVGVDGDGTDRTSRNSNHDEDDDYDKDDEDNEDDVEDEAKNDNALDGMYHADELHEQPGNYIPLDGAHAVKDATDSACLSVNDGIKTISIYNSIS